MNEILQKSFNTLTMSSREIATLCDKEHRNVCRDIRAYVGAIVQMERGIDVRSMDWDGKEGVELFEHTPIGGVTMKYEINPQNKQAYPVYYLDKNATLTIITGYSILFRKRIIDRWQQLEQATAPRLPQTFADALRAYADEVEAHEQTKIALETAKPKAQYFDALVERNLLTSFRITAKELKLKQNAFIQALLDDKYIYRDGKGKLMPYAQHTPSLFEVKEFTKGGYANVQTMITPKGREVFKLLYSQTIA